MTETQTRITRDAQLPPDVQALPRHARRVWKAAFNASGDGESAWDAVRGKYTESEGGLWKRKPAAEVVEAVTADNHKTRLGLSHFVALAKLDEAKREVWGWAAEEAPDNANEVMDYDLSKPYWLEWSNKIKKASGGKSVGNLRRMHSLQTIGKLVHLEPRDDLKKFWVGAYVSDDQSWADFQQGVLNGFSVGGDYVRSWRDPSNPLLKRYIARPLELSAVDSPCMRGATVEYVKADGSTDLMKIDLHKNVQVGEDYEQTEAAADTSVGDEDIKNSQEEAAEETHDSNVERGGVVAPEDKEPDDTSAHDQAIEILQNIRNEAEAAGQLQEADLLTQAITLVVGAHGMSQSSPLSLNAANSESSTAAQGEAPAKEDTMAKVDDPKESLMKVGAMLSAANMSGIHAIIKALAEMGARAGDQLASKVAQLYADPGTVESESPSEDAQGESQQAKDQTPAPKDAGTQASDQKPTVPANNETAAKPAAEGQTDEGKAPSGNEPPAKGDGKPQQAADGEGEDFKTRFKKADEIEQKIVKDLGVIASFIQNMDDRLLKLESMPATQSGPAVRVVPIHGNTATAFDAEEAALVEALSKTSDPVSRSAIENRLSTIRLKKVQSQPIPMAR